MLMFPEAYGPCVPSNFQTNPSRCKPDSVPTLSGGILGHPKNLIDGREALDDFIEPVLPQRDQPALAAELAQVVDIGAPRHHVAERVVHDQQLVNAQPARVPGLAAAVAALALVRLVGVEA